MNKQKKSGSNNNIKNKSKNLVFWSQKMIMEQIPSPKKKQFLSQTLL